ncbi:MAG: twin-arginine translocase subunit TatC [Chloroflexota bacterium]
MKIILVLLIKIVKAPFIWLWGVLMAILKLTPLRDFLIEEPEDTPILDTVQKATEEPKEFFFALLEHLNDLRKNLVRAIIGLTITTIISFYFVTDILDWLSLPIGGIEQLQAIEVTEPIGVVMRVSLMAGFSMALPYMTFELLRFIAPGISQRARLLGLFGIPFVSLFFAAGMAFAYYVMLPAALPVLLNFMGIPTLPRPSSYIRFVSGIMFWIGVSFEFPLVTYILSAMGILPAKALKNNWRLAFILLAILAAMITPTVDPINMLIVLLPLWVLYGLSILMAYVGQGRKGKQAETT